MANTDWPSGLQPVRNRNGSHPEIVVMDCVSTVLYEGALAFMSSSGLVGMCSSSVISSTLAKDIVGVFAEAKPASTVGAEGSKSKVRVYIDPEQLYEIQFDDNSVTGVNGIINRVFPILTPAAGNALNRSTSELDGSAGAAAACASATAAEIFQPIAIVKGPRNGSDASASWTRVVGKLVPKAHIHRNNLGV